MAGASRPRVSEHLTEFEDQHLITRRKRQMIVNRDQVESFLSQPHPNLNGDSSWA
jgi:predicted transcriptional regulator